MSTPPKQPFEVYMGQVLAQLRHLSTERRAAVADELRAHLHDAATDAGRPPDDLDVQGEVIRALGSPRRLGRALARAHRDERESRSAGWLWWAWVGVAAVGWPSGALVGLFSPSVGVDTALLAVPLGGMVAALMQLLVLRRIIPGAIPDAVTPALFCSGWLLGTVLVALTPFQIEAVAAGRNAAEPLLLSCTLGALAVLGYAVTDIVRQLVRRRERRRYAAP